MIPRRSGKRLAIASVVAHARNLRTRSAPTDATWILTVNPICRAMAFIIVGKESPVYELSFVGAREDLARQALYVLHSALDMVELTVWANPAT